MGSPLKEGKVRLEVDKILYTAIHWLALWDCLCCRYDLSEDSIAWMIRTVIFLSLYNRGCNVQHNHTIYLNVMKKSFIWIGINIAVKAYNNRG